jgi:hypothetical protein
MEIANAQQAKPIEPVSSVQSETTMATGSERASAPEVAPTQSIDSGAVTHR